MHRDPSKNPIEERHTTTPVALSEGPITTIYTSAIPTPHARLMQTNYEKSATAYYSTIDTQRLQFAFDNWHGSRHGQA